MDRQQRRRVFTVLLAVITSATTLTVVHKCVMVDTLKIQKVHTTAPVGEIAQAVHGTVIASAEVVLPRRDTVVVHDTVRTVRVVTRWMARRDTRVGVAGALDAVRGGGV